MFPRPIQAKSPPERGAFLLENWARIATLPERWLPGHIHIKPLVMAVMFGLALLTLQILLRIFLERSLATGRTEVIGFPLVLVRSRSFAFFDFHTANRIYCHHCLLSKTELGFTP